LRRGFSLVELMLAAALLGALTTGLLLLYHMGLQARKRHDAHQRTYRAVMVALGHLRGELRGVQMFRPAIYGGPVLDSALYRSPSMQDNRLVVDSSGTP
jgi:prepilin-type N-terminal cleavage/methylation domain-containing protein